LEPLSSATHVFPKHQNLVATLLYRSRPTSVAVQSHSHLFQWRIYTTQLNDLPPKQSSVGLLLEHRQPMPLTRPSVLIHLAVSRLSRILLVLHPTRTLKYLNLSVSVPHLRGSPRAAADDTSQIATKFVPPVVILGTLLQRLLRQG
jgi:hypothetical protein